jgi:small subunit ribosomal protein S16
MPVKIRLQRHGKKGKPFYWVVAADSRAKRDGKFLEKLGIYDPNTNPAIIEVKIDNAVKWLQNGAQPTDTARAILSYKGVMLKHHLLGGLRKGALTEEQVEEKFNAWVEEKEKSVATKVGGLEKVKADEKAKALAAEKEVSEKRALAAVEAELPEAEAATETPEGEEAVEAKVEETATEEVAETATETKEAEKVEEAPKEEAPAKEEVAEAAPEAEVVEKVEEAPKEEAKADSEDKASNEEE